MKSYLWNALFLIAFAFGALLIFRILMSMLKPKKR